jgi:hypothetical protein
MKRILTFHQLFEAAKPKDTSWMPTPAEISQLEIFQNLRDDHLIRLSEPYLLTQGQIERNVRSISFSTDTNNLYRLEPNSDGTINIKFGRSYIAKNKPFKNQEEMTDVIIYLMIVTIAIYDPVWSRKPHNPPKRTPFNDDHVKLNGELERGDLEGLLNGITELMKSKFGFCEERLVQIAIILMWYMKSATQEAKNNFIKQLIVNVTAERMFLHWCHLPKILSHRQPFVSMPAVTEGLSMAFSDFLNNNGDAPMPPALGEFLSKITDGFRWIKIR